MSDRPVTRRLVLVVGAGRSGTSLTAGLLNQLGFHVPQPEVQANFTNPRGFGEPRWVVDFHARLMSRNAVALFDARPAAWDATAAAGQEPAVVAELSRWLRSEFAEHDRVVVKDPRTVWFVPLWQRCAHELGLQSHFVTAIRHPTQVLRSIRTTAGDRQSEASRAAWWVSTMLNTERATRSAARAFAHYEDVVADWRSAMSRIERLAGLPIVTGADDAALSAADAFVDPSLRRSSSGWEDLKVPEPVRQIAETVWSELGRLATADADDPAVLGRLDTLRTEYNRLYADAEAISDSSAWYAVRTAAAARPAAAPSLLLRLKRKLPPRVRAALGRLRRGLTGAKR